MSVLVVNPAHGVAGDMLAAALAGLAGQEVLEVVAPLEGVRVGLRQVARHGIAAGLLEVEVAAPAAGLSFAHLREELGRTRLGTQGMRLALSSLQWLEEAEGRAHGHGASALHELGTLDTVVDIAFLVEQVKGTTGEGLSWQAAQRKWRLTGGYSRIRCE
jgi:uncharacterized protein (DUF111 family)